MWVLFDLKILYNMVVQYWFLNALYNISDELNGTMQNIIWLAKEVGNIADKIVLKFS
jgi:hypothetical protein